MMTNSTKQVKHTPVPWRVGFESDFNGLRIETADGVSSLGTIWGENHRENAKFTIRACNSHEELLEACKRGLSRVKELTELCGHTPGFSYETVNILEQAIAKAECQGKE